MDKENKSKEGNARRGFIKKMSLLISSAAAAPVIARWYSNSNTKNKMTSVSAIKRILPLGFQWDVQDPFLFCVHHEDNYPKGNGSLGPDSALLQGRSLGDDFIIKDGFRMYHGTRVPGFPGHPHRGFETVTVVRKGIVDHLDSLGAAGRYGNGDVQWMTAGKGVQHAEMFPLVHTDKENTLELFQIWLNLPKSNKMVEPYFKMLWKEEIPILEETDSNGNKIKVEIIAGNLKDKKAIEPPPNSWAANVENYLGIWNIVMPAHSQFTLPKTAEGVNRSIYFYEGDTLAVNDTEIEKYSCIEVEPTVDIILKSTDTEMKILVLQGKPISETVIQYGPFVMNTKEEIMQAFNDYHETQFGGWPWPAADHTHEPAAKRFAKHADGSVEQKDSL